MQTPADRVTMIGSLLEGAPQELRDCLKVEADSSFQVDAITLAARAYAR
jgi:hypothetical protein